MLVIYYSKFTGLFKYKHMELNSILTLEKNVLKE
ncbi:Uncharacterised protein [Staphylococcus gallinarum]|uniref:Uncharacterized protein n=1 Tax=Staphylococcus gallinarum TaxID=1293 RepID=A0A380FFK1_STAGA|nr:Uncharacterised protein [Staphylococcus gallinarum]